MQNREAAVLETRKVGFWGSKGSIPSSTCLPLLLTFFHIDRSPALAQDKHIRSILSKLNICFFLINLYTN